MISWMQKHNKYLVWTIWVATIAFIGAGFVGWGSYDFGSKAGNVAKVGDIEISQKKLNMAYSNVYNQYNETLKGELDEKKAKEMGLIKQAFSQIEIQARILNFAKDVGIVVSNDEILKRLQSIPSFQEKDVFNREYYNRYLQNQRLKANEFEETLKEDLIIQKTLSLLRIDLLPLEKEAIASAMNISDKLAYIILSKDDLNFKSQEKDVKDYWKTNRDNFMTNKLYELSIVWTNAQDSNISDDEINNYYQQKSFNYTDKDGKQLSLKEATDLVIKDIKLKKIKKIAQKAYISFKKGQEIESQKMSLRVSDNMLTDEIWKIIETKSVGDIIKPKAVHDRYATIKIEKIILPKTKTYEEAKEQATYLYNNQAEKDALYKLADKSLKEFNQSKATISDFIKLDGGVILDSLSSQESIKFLQKLFTSTKEKGMIEISDKIVVYHILEQKLLPMDNLQADFLLETISKIKQGAFESNLIKVLGQKYPTETYMGGLTN